VTTIPHRELRNESSRILRAVQAGERFEVTNHGEVVAILAPPGVGGSELRVRLATTKGGFAALRRARIDHPVQEGLDHLRAER
jgi:antitoxin (DNA-binding transcriptional repressor) of toxin-antitoxin stability system